MIVSTMISQPILDVPRIIGDNGKEAFARRLFALPGGGFSGETDPQRSRISVLTDRKISQLVATRSAPYCNVNLYI